MLILGDNPMAAAAVRAARQRRRALLRRQAQQRMRPGTPPPAPGRRHHPIQTEKYLEEILKERREIEMEKKKKRSWDQKNLQKAMDKVLSKEMSLREASLRYDIPRSTLHDKTSLLNLGKEVSLTPKIGRFTKTFSPEYEETLVEHVKNLSNRCLPLMKKEFLKLAFDLAETLKIPHRFNKDKGLAGKYFYYDFMQRHPDISLRTPKLTSMMRAVGFNKPQVDLFYDNLEKLMTQYKFEPSHIYNCDETGVSCVQKHQKVIALKALRQIGKLTSAERVKSITVRFCMSANGHFVPPFFVFPMQRMNDRLMVNAPTESVGVAQPKGWINSDFFLQWLQLFIKHSRPTKKNPVLVLLDGHCSHKTLAVINCCRENNIQLLSSPPHTTHKLQPLDRTFMKPFKDAYNQQCDMWMRANARSRKTDYDIAGLVNKAFTKVARMEIAVSGFICTGIYPFDRNLFSDLDYLPTDVTVAGSSSTTCNAQLSNNLVSEEPANPPQGLTSEPTIGSPKPSTSYDLDLAQIVHQLSPLPDAAKKRSTARKRKCEKSEILISSPYKVVVEEKENEKSTKNKKKEIGNKFKTAIREKGKQTKGIKVKGKSGDKVKKNEPLIEVNNTRTVCVVFLEDHDEDWIQCSSCRGWAHEACADIPECSKGYICDRCMIF
ncbi:Pogo transposable element with KRAB domain [Eumeta japonica]|uniref:Pogo transposable element with KRAB domain n=1 Tax=Eumeta variegata TaxID=151549 RepID=A0A4C1U097_EUMVA|nr:Pogo transposable element with KRAB domain [Eumeta japonica]